MKRIYTNEEIKHAQEKLEQFLPDKKVCDGALFSKFYNTHINQNFTQKDLKRINVLKCHFETCNFKATAGTGSKFKQVKFDNCDFTGSNFQYCYFTDAKFINKSIIHGANFSHSVFVDCKFENMAIMQSTFYDCYFENCTFLDSEIKSITLENSVMCKCTILNINLSELNLDFLRFDNIHMENVLLPPYQIPYIIGGPLYIKDTSDSISINNDNTPMDASEYSGLYEDLARYFYSLNEYFPVANIYIALGRHELAFECIELGIRNAFDYYDFRMIKYFCKLACSNKAFTHSQLKMLYDLITNSSYDNSWDVNTFHSYMLNIGEIREMLLNNSLHKERVEFVVKTNIEKDDLISINSLYNQINGIIRENCSDSHIDSIELRHNSPYEIYITCIDSLPNILIFISAMYSLLSTGNKLLEFYKNFEETRRVHQQNKLYKYEVEEKQIDIETKKLQLKELQEKLAPSEAKTASGIYLVTEIEHSIKCNSINAAKDIAPEYLHFKYSKDILEQ